jgi:hypothetical protein
MPGLLLSGTAFFSESDTLGSANGARSGIPYGLIAEGLRGCGSQVHSYRCAGAGFHLFRLSALALGELASLSDVLVLLFADALFGFAAL